MAADESETRAIELVMSGVASAMELALERMWAIVEPVRAIVSLVSRKSFGMSGLLTTSLAEDTSLLASLETNCRLLDKSSTDFCAWAD